MFKRIIRYIQRLFFREKQLQQPLPVIKKRHSRIDLVDSIKTDDKVNNTEGLIDIETIFHIPDPEILNPNNSKTLLIMDDSKEALLLLEYDFRMIYKDIGRDPREGYRVVICKGNQAGKIAYKYIKSNRVDKALLDITLSNDIIKFNNGEFIILDGIDLAIEIKRRYPECQLAMLSGHDITGAGAIQEYSDRFRDSLGYEIEDVFINKMGADRKNMISDLLFTDRFRDIELKYKKKKEKLKNKFLNIKIENKLPLVG